MFTCLCSCNVINFSLWNAIYLKQNANVCLAKRDTRHIKVTEAVKCIISCLKEKQDDKLLYTASNSLLIGY